MKSTRHVILRRHSFTSRARVPALLLLCLFAADANAYIDPNSGGLLYQILLPMIIAVTAGWRYLKMAVRNFIHGLFGRRDASNEKLTEPSGQEADEA